MYAKRNTHSVIAQGDYHLSESQILHLPADDNSGVTLLSAVNSSGMCFVYIFLIKQQHICRRCNKNCTVCIPVYVS